MKSHNKAIEFVRSTSGPHRTNNSLCDLLAAHGERYVEEGASPKAVKSGPQNRIRLTTTQLLQKGRLE